MRRQGYAMRRGHSHGAIPEEQPSALPDAAVAELPGLLLTRPKLSLLFGRIQVAEHGAENGHADGRLEHEPDCGHQRGGRNRRGGAGA